MLTVGEILKKHRETQGKSLSQIEKELKIREKFLHAIENNEWNSFSSKVYISGIIKAYARTLDIDHSKLIAFFRREYEQKEKIEFKKKVSSKYLTPQTKKLMFIGLAFIFLLFFVYFGYQLSLYFSPPKMTILSPVNKITTTDEKIKVKGKTEKEAIITILGDRVFQNKEGMFEYEFPLKPGKNELKIEVVGANGKKTVVSQEYVRKKL